MQHDDDSAPTPQPDGARPLTGAQRRFLRARAHHLQPVVRIGREGITEGLLQAVDRALTDHELVKVKVLENAPLERAEAAPRLAETLGAHVAGQVGRIVMLYRRHPDRPRLRLPEPGRPGGVYEPTERPERRDPKRRPASRRRRTRAGGRNGRRSGSRRGRR